MKTFEISRVRESLGMSQESFSKILGVSLSTVNRWEKGRQVPSNLQTQQIMALKGLINNEAIDQRTLLDIVNVAGVSGAIMAAAMKGVEINGSMGIALRGLMTGGAVSRLLKAS